MSSSRVIKWEGREEKNKINKKNPAEKKNIVPHWILFFCRFLREVTLKEKFLFSFFFFKNRTSGWLYITPAFFAVCSCEVVMCRLVLEMMKVHLHWRDNQAGHGCKKEGKRRLVNLPKTSMDINIKFLIESACMCVCMCVCAIWLREM